MKKKIVGIVVALVAVLALVAGGIWLFTNRDSAVETGNKLDVSWYDVNGKEFTITTADQLYELAELSKYYDFEDQTIYLGADIVVNEGNASDWLEKAPERKWSPITGFAGTFDGQGHTISGIYGQGFNISMALFANTDSSCIIRDFKLLNSCFNTSGYGGTASIASNVGGKFEKIYSDAILNCNGENCGGLFSKAETQATFEECWFDGTITMTGRTGGGIVDSVVGTRVTMKHCLFSGSITDTWYYSGSRVGGLCGYINENSATLIINDCLASGTISAGNAYYTGAAIGAVYAKTSVTTIDSYTSTLTYDAVIGRSGSNGTFSGMPLAINGKDLIAEGGYAWTYLDFENYWTIAKESTPILKYFASEVISTDGLAKAFDISWYDENSDTYTISNLEQLIGLSFLSASTDFSGKTIKLDADIVLNEGNAADWANEAPDKIWYPINKFAGTFDGQGHTISGIYINTASDYIGLFKQTTGAATVKNLSVKNSYFNNTGVGSIYMATISGRGGGTFENIYTDAIIVSTGNLIGGIVGQINEEANNKISNCWFDGSITLLGESARYAGGMAVTVVKGTNVIEHCLNTGSISAECTGMGVFLGGIASAVMNEGTKLTIRDTLNVGKITNAHGVCVGAILGRAQSGELILENVYATMESYQHQTNGFMGLGTQSVATVTTGSVTGFAEADLSGINAYQYTALDFDNYWAVISNSTPELKYFSGEGMSVAGAWRLDTSWYDESKSSFTISTMGQLYGFASLVNSGVTFEGKTVKLGADITVNTGSAADWKNGAKATNVWTPIGGESAPFQGTFDGQGHTISGIYCDRGSSAYVGLFGHVANCTIKNFSLKNSYFASTAKNTDMGSIAGHGDGKLENIYSDAIIVSGGTRTGGFVGASTDDVTKDENGKVNNTSRGENADIDIINCWFDGEIILKYNENKTSNVGGFIGYVLWGTADFEHCLFTGKILGNNTSSDKITISNVGGIYGRANNSCAVTIIDSLSAGTIVKDTATTGDVAFSATGSIAGVAGSLTASDRVYATEECFASTGASGVSQMAESRILGLDGYRRTNLDFASYWAARTDKVPALKSFVADSEELSTDGVSKEEVKEITPDTSWYTDGTGNGTQANPYKIYNKEDLYGLAQLVNGGTSFAGKYIQLQNNITVNENWTAGSGIIPDYTWNPIGTDVKNAFQGTFDGQGYTIDGIYANSSSTNVGLFGYTMNSAIKNLSLKNSYFRSTATTATNMGSIIGYGEGVLQNVYSSAIVCSKDGQRIGGLIGAIQDNSNSSAATQNTVCTITNCWFEGTLELESSSSMYAGGFVGYTLHGTVTINNSVYNGTINYKCTGSETVKPIIGGFIGRDNTTVTLTITNCVSAGTINVTKTDAAATVQQVGSVMGLLRKDNQTMTDMYVSSSYTVPAYTPNSASTVVTKAVVTPKDFAGENVLTETLTALNAKAAENSGWYSWVEKAGVPVLDFAYVAPEEPEQPGEGGSGEEESDVIVADTSWFTDATKDDDGNEPGQPENPYMIFDAADLYGLATLVNSGTPFDSLYIQLRADINVNERWDISMLDDEDTTNDIPTNIWTPIGTATNAFTGHFDGDGHTIKGIYVAAGSTHAGLFGYATNCEIKNLKLVDSYIAGGSTATGSIVGGGDGALSNIYTNARIVSEKAIVGGIIGRVSDGNKDTTTCTIENCWFDGNITFNYGGSGNLNVGGIVGYLVHGNNAEAPSVMRDCLSTGTIKCVWNYAGETAVTKQANVGGLVAKANASNNSVMQIINCVSATTITTEISNTELASFTHIDSVTPVLGGMTITAPVYATPASSVANVTELTDLSAALTALSANSSNWKIVTVNNVDKLILASFEDTTADTSWFDANKTTTEADPYLITDIGDLYGLADLVNSGTLPSGAYIKLRSDIDLNSGWDANAEVVAEPANVWTPIGTAANAFTGHFDGDGHTIKGIYVATGSTHAGLFGYATNCEIKNLKLVDSYIAGGSTATGSIVGGGDGALSNIYTNARIVSEKPIVGGIIGRVSDGNKGTTTCTIENCWFDGNITFNYGGSGNLNAGGIVGYLVHGNNAEAPSVMRDCLSTGTIKCVWNYAGETAVTKQANVGGLVAKANASNNSVMQITNCVSATTITTEISNTELASFTHIDSVTPVLGGMTITAPVYAAPASSAANVTELTDNSAAATALGATWTVKNTQLVPVAFEALVPTVVE